ncbi:MAG TPA: serine/threonine-protein kinase [Kofleriaceae bacterium]
MEPVTHIGKYEVGRKLGQGGFGEIYVARDTGLDREIAIKVLRGEHTQRPQLVQRFLQEARAAARINHPGIVTVFECGEIEAHVVYIAMELLAGETLAARIKREPLPLPTVIALTRQLASALAAAHSAGIVHRDLKPQNVFLVPDAAAVGGLRVKILDFGIAKLTDTLGSSIQTHSMEMMGTPLYMSPEQCKSSATVDARSDIYSLGCILFELAAGRTPFEGDAGELIAKHQLVAPPKLSEAVSGAPPELERLVADMLAKAPGDRPQTMGVIVDALDAMPTSSTLVRIAPRAADVQYAPTLAPGGTMTDPRAVQLAETTPAHVTHSPPTAPALAAQPASTSPPTMNPPAVPAPRPRSRAARGLMIAIAISAVAVAGIVVGVFASGSDAAKKIAKAIDQDDDDAPKQTPAPGPGPQPTKIVKSDDGDDDDDDDDKPKPPVPPTPPSHPSPKTPTTPKIPKIDLSDLTGLAEACKPLVQQSIDAENRGDSAAAAAIAAKLATCETKSLGISIPGTDDKCTGLLEAGKKADASGDHETALEQYQAAYDCKPDPTTLRLAVKAACNAGDADSAKALWPKLSAREKAKLAPVCAKHDVSVE